MINTMIIWSHFGSSEFPINLTKKARLWSIFPCFYLIRGEEYNIFLIQVKKQIMEAINIDLLTSLINQGHCYS